MGRLDGKVAIVTGGAGGIGRAITRAYVAEGARVAFVDLDEDAGRALAADLGDAARFVRADLSDPASTEVVVAAAVDAFGPVSVLVNGAHASRQAPLVEHTEELFELSFGTGFRPTFRLMQACYPMLRETRGSVINFGSGAGLSGGVTQASYAAAKEAIRGLSRVAANEWAADGIRVNVICPIAETEGVRAWKEQFPDHYERALRTIPMRRWGDADHDVAPVAVFLASDDSRYMTGQTLMADGGSIMLR